jgi:ATP:ADP antiporter, AAA family
VVENFNPNRLFRDFLLTTFDIREGELHRALLMQLNIFLIITTLLIIKPAVNGLFLSRFGVSHLPYAFILVAIVAAAVSTLYSRLLLEISLSRMMIYTLRASVISLLFFGTFLSFHIWEGPVLYLLYIFVAIFALLTTSQFWVLANVVFNAREARRLFGFVGAGAIVGGIFGGYLTSILTRFMSSEQLPFVCAGFLIICIPVTMRIWNREVIPYQTAFQQKKNVNPASTHPIIQIRKSRHLTYIAIIVGLSVLVAKLVDYQFGAVASTLIPDPDELTAFFGFWFSTFNVISLLTQLFVTKRVVGTFGVGSSLYLLPGSIFVAVLLLMIFPGFLLAAVFLKMADGGLKQSINKAAMELLIIPIPQEVKNQTKTFIDVFVDSLATGLSGLILIFLVNGLQLSTMSINILIVIILFIWMYTAYLVRGEYFKSFRQKIDFVKHSKRKNEDIRSDSVIGGMRRVLEEGTEEQIVFILQKAKELNDERLFPAVKNLIYHPSEAIRTGAIQYLYYYKKQKLLEEIEPMVNDPSQSVKIAVFDYLLAHASTNRLDVINTYLQHEDYKISIAALVSLSRETRTNQSLKIMFQLGHLIRQKITEVDVMEPGAKQQFCILGLLKAVGYAGIPSLYPFIQQYMHSDNITLARQAVRSAGETMQPQFLEPLMNLMANEQLVTTSRQALLHYGDSVLDVLIEEVQTERLELEVVRKIPGVVKQIPLQKSVNFLFELLDYPDIVVRQEVLRALNSLRNEHPLLTINSKKILQHILNEAHLFQQNISVLYSQTTIYKIGNQNKEKRQAQAELFEARAGLIDLLRRRLDRSIERIFRLLGLTYQSADIVSIYRGLHSNLPDLQMNALEFLDNLLEPGLKKTLIPLIETSMLETISEEAIKNLNLEVPNEMECLSLLLKEPDLKIQQSVLYLIGKFDDRAYLPLLEEFKAECSERLLPVVNELLEKLK